jgi:hypothetical protein
MNVVETLELAKKKLCIGWTKDACARTAAGTPVLSAHKDAVCWCLLGAIGVSTCSSGNFNEAVFALERALPADCWQSISLFNDAEERTIEQVLELVDRAIAMETQV